MKCTRTGWWHADKGKVRREAEQNAAQKSAAQCRKRLHGQARLLSRASRVWFAATALLQNWEKSSRRRTSGWEKRGENEKKNAWNESATTNQKALKSFGACFDFCNRARDTRTLANQLRHLRATVRGARQADLPYTTYLRRTHSRYIALIRQKRKVKNGATVAEKKHNQSSIKSVENSERKKRFDCHDHNGIQTGAITIVPGRRLRLLQNGNAAIWWQLQRWWKMLSSKFTSAT